MKKNKCSIVDTADHNCVASASECTGLIPSLPASAQEAEAYTDIYAIAECDTQE